MLAQKQELEVKVEEVVDFTRLMGSFALALNEVVRRKVTAEAARKKGIHVDASDIQKVADDFRLLHDLHSAQDTEQWFKENGITIERFEEFLETNILVSKFRDDLVCKENVQSFLSSEPVMETIKDVAYSRWIRNALK